MRITGIETTKKGRYALMIDGEFAFSVHRDTFLTTPGLQTGAELTPEQLETLRREDERRSARESALDYLSAAEQTTGTLRQKLLRRYGEQAVEAALTRMQELGLLDDLDYSRRYAADAVNLKGYPRRRIARELQKKGVPQPVIEEVLTGISPETETETACRLLQKQYAEKLGDRREREKAMAALYRRGFSQETIQAAMRRLPVQQPEPEETADAGAQILELIRKKYLKNLTDRKGIEKTVAALYRRGYSPEEIRAGIRRILEEQPQGLQEEMYCDD